MKKLRRVVAVILSLIMVLGSMTNVFAAPGKTFKYVSFDIETSDDSDYEITGVWRVYGRGAREELNRHDGGVKYSSRSNFDKDTVFEIQVKLSNGEYVNKTLRYNDGKLKGQTLTFSIDFQVVKVEPEYTVTYAGAEDVNNLPSDNKSYKEGDEVTLSTVEPTREGYRFKGWLLDNSLVTDTFTVGKSNIVLQADWIKLYQISYVVDNKVVETKVVDEGTDVSNFAEYKYTNISEDKNISDWTLETDDVNLEALNKDIVVSAETSVKTFNVTYSIDGSVVDEFTVEYGTDIELKDVPTYEDKNFTGWEVKSGSLTNITEDVVIAGSTSVKKFVVTYKVDGEVVETVENVAYGSDVPNFEYTPDTGYDFSGWTNKPEKVTTDHVIEGTTTIKSFVVEFVDANGNVISNEYTYGSQVTAPEGPKKSDLKIENGTGAAQWIRYTFDKWVAQGDYDIDDLNSVTEEMTFQATYTEKPVKVYYYLLNRGIEQPEEPGSHDSKNYSKNGVEGGIKSFTAVANDDEKVQEVIFDAPEASEFGITLNEGEYIKWYVVKKVNEDKWHVDGIIVGQQYNVTVEYIDAETNESIKENTVTPVAATEEYNITLPQIEGYELVDATTVVAGVMPYDNVKATVKYQKIEHTVTYKVNGEVVDEFTVKYGEDVPASTHVVPEGYDFTGFELVTEVEDASVVKQDMVFEATQTIKTFTVTYYLNGELYFETVADYGDAKELLGSPAGESHIFSGWTASGDLSNITDNIEIVGSTTVKTFVVTYIVDGEVVDEFTVEYGEDVPTSTYEVPEGYEFTGFELVTEVEDASVVKQAMAFEGTTSLIVVEEEEEEDVEIDTPFAPGTTEEDDNDAEDDSDETVVDTDESATSDAEEEDIDLDTPFVPGATEDGEADVEEEEDIDLDTPFDSGVQTGDASNYSVYVVALLIAAVGAMVIAYNKKRAIN